MAGETDSTASRSIPERFEYLPLAPRLALHSPPFSHDLTKRTSQTPEFGRRDMTMTTLLAILYCARKANGVHGRIYQAELIPARNANQRLRRIDYLQGHDCTRTAGSAICYAR
jgi:hypothetical protein